MDQAYDNSDVIAQILELRDQDAEFAEQIEQALDGKQDALTATQMNAVNSGITASKVSTYDGYATQIAGKQDALSTAQMNAANSGITSAKVSTYDGYASQIAGKQDTLSTAQMNAANSGITAAKVSQYDGYASGKQNTLSTAQMNAVNSGITSAKVSQYDGYASQIAAKQDTLIAGSNISIVDNVISATGGGGGGVTVDSALSTTSPNPVENRVITNALGDKQDALSTAQMNAANSGITAAKVSTYDGYAAQITGKQDALSTAQMNAANSGITSAKVSTYDGYASQIAGKQDALSAAQLNAANSGITAAKVSTYDGYAAQIAAKQNAIQTAQITVPAAGGTVTVTGMTATAFVIVSPDPSSFDVYATAGCRCTAQASNALTFAVDETASVAMTVNVGWFA